MDEAVSKYENDTRELSEFIEGRIGFTDCIHALDASLSHAIPNLRPKHLIRLQAAMRENTERFLTAVRFDHHLIKLDNRSLGYDELNQGAVRWRSNSAQDGCRGSD